MKHIILLDMDNVLLKPLGYRRALQATLRAVSYALGFHAPDLDDEVIEQIEAYGVTSEWEIVAISAAIMLANLPPSRARMPDRLNLTSPDDALEPPPPILPTFAMIAQMNPQRSPLDRTMDILLADGASLSAEHRQQIRWTLTQARTVESVTFRTIQELVLGSVNYQKSYSLEPCFAIESYLDTFDRASLESPIAECLHEWRRVDDREAVIFTNRPSTPPAGHRDTPEAEIGAALVGLAELPIIGSGDLGWLANRQEQRPDQYLKPSGVHALSALLLAAGIDKADALRRAWSLIHDTDTTRSWWETLGGTQVIVFEDSAKGFQSALNAQSALAAIDIPITVKLRGISRHPAKRAELARHHAQIFADVNQALRAFLPDCTA